MKNRNKNFHYSNTSFFLVFKKDLDQMNETQLRETLLEVESLKNAIENRLWEGAPFGKNNLI